MSASLEAIKPASSSITGLEINTEKYQGAEALGAKDVIFEETEVHNSFSFFLYKSLTGTTALMSYSSSNQYSEVLFATAD